MRKTFVLPLATLAGLALSMPAMAGEGGCNWAMKTAQAKAKKVEQVAATQVPVKTEMPKKVRFASSQPMERFIGVF